MTTTPSARQVIASLAASWLFSCNAFAAAPASPPLNWRTFAEVPSLPELNIDLKQTTVSGISSGAFMAVQLGVAHSASVKGVAATAGGPYFCVEPKYAGGQSSKAIAHCMQGDPFYLPQPIGVENLKNMSNVARTNASEGNIDPVSHMEKQKFWLFHGYNDAIVKKPVSDALYQWVLGFTPAAQVFYKDEIKAAHAQVSAVCSDKDASCQGCEVTGNNFINHCNNDTGNTLYDPAGAALQLFYGPLVRTDSDQLSSRPQVFDQIPYTYLDKRKVVPFRISLANRGYLYVPKTCAKGQPCRLHIAFHGCLQQAEKIDTAFVDKAGFNEWADANHIVVLYPQATASIVLPNLLINPQSCWDWWGFNDLGYEKPGRYATQKGDQLGAVWLMAQRLAAGVAKPAMPAQAAGPQLKLIDASSNQVALAWQPVAGASGYRLYRNNSPLATLNGGQHLSWVDNALTPKSSYQYQLRTLDAQGRETGSSAIVLAQTGSTAPACDPYFSLLLNRLVTKNYGKAKPCE